jgi:nuclear pore complex protein Nup62
LATLYNHVLAAEREQSEIDQSLDHIEQQQKDLATTLDAYEKSTEEILGRQGGSLRVLDSGPADAERDKRRALPLLSVPWKSLILSVSSFMLATDLYTHLDDLSSSLSQMIETVNELSLPSADGSAQSSSGDDPMNQIAQILSAHLESLQWIDGALREVESKVTDVEKRVKESGIAHSGLIGLGSKSRNFTSR